MSGFERYLTSQGYSVYHFDTKSMRYIPGYENISSMWNLDNRYSKETIEDGNHPSDLIIYGLQENGYPPYVNYPELPNPRADMEELSNEQLLIKLNNYRINYKNHVRK